MISVKENLKTVLTKLKHDAFAFIQKSDEHFKKMLLLVTRAEYLKAIEEQNRIPFLKIFLRRLI